MFIMSAAPTQKFGLFYVFETSVLASSARLILHLNKVEYSTSTEFTTPTESEIILIAGIVTGSTLLVIAVVIVIVTVAFFCVWRRLRSKSSSKNGNIQVPSIR